MPDIGERLTPAAAAAVRAAIADAGGNEIFLLGTLSERRVSDVRVLARGNRRAAPAILQVPRPGEVVIHNHPSGRLTPSDADLEVASALGNNGVGSYIVNDDVSDVYVIVEPLAETAAQPIDPQAVLDLLGPGGRIARALPGYEHRTQQLDMAAAVARAFNSRSILTVEAGTGTGKSLAYLVPAILWCAANQQRVVVSTHTINLQEQLVHKDLPFLVERAGLTCRVALVKGRGNYLCRRKAAQVEAQPALLIEDELSRELRGLLEWATRTADGSLGDLPVRPRGEVWEQVVSESDNCLRARCPFFSSCFFYAARRAAAVADILVVNHHLLMADLALRDEMQHATQNAVLPPAAHVILDEAHHLEDVATLYFGQRAGLAAIERTLGRLQSARAERKGVLPALLNALDGLDAPDAVLPAQGARRWIEERLLPRRRSLGADAEEIFARLLTAYASGAGRILQSSEKTRITAEVRATEFWALAVDSLERLAHALHGFAADANGVLERLEQIGDTADKTVLYLGTELRALQGRLAAIADALLAFTEHDPTDGFGGPDDNQCRWVELQQRAQGSVLTFNSAPIEVAPLLRRSLFDRFETAVLTSATLAVDGRFAYLHERVGLRDLDPPERSQTLRVESPFDFARQALLAVPSDLPDPSQPAYEAATHAAIRGVLRLTRGGTFILFTAYGALNRAFAALEADLSSAGLTPLKQGDASRHALLAQFTRDPGAVLFATDSFWEGVDVKGDALRCVIIARLPFRVPTEPIEQSRVEAIEARGGNAFLDHAVPQAVLKLKQGFGRLIRSRTDRGCVVILDSRIVNKRYGRAFLASLPPARPVVAPLDQVLAEMQHFSARPVRDIAARNP